MKARKTPSFLGKNLGIYKFVRICTLRIVFRLIDSIFNQLKSRIWLFKKQWFRYCHNNKGS